MEINSLPSYLSFDGLDAWGIFVEQIRRVQPDLGELAALTETFPSVF